MGICNSWPYPKTLEGIDKAFWGPRILSIMENIKELLVKAYGKITGDTMGWSSDSVRTKKTQGGYLLD